MSSQEEDSVHTQENAAFKKRKGPACDKCRSKKVRCNGRPGERCNNCIAGNHECTFLTNAKKRYPDLARIEELENQLANMKKLLNKLHPGVDFTAALNGYVDNNSLWMVDPKDPKLSNTTEKSIPLPPPRPTLIKPELESEDLDPSDEDVAHPSPLERSFKAMSIQTGPPRFLGKSSRFYFFKKAYELKYEAAGREPPNLRDRDFVIPWKKNCSELYVSQPWIIPILQIHESPQYHFPEPELLKSLVKCFFDQTIKFMPLLHRPTFEKQINAGLHFTDEGFATVMMLVCSLGSRFSDDPRVLQDNTDSWYSAGWKWFAQVQNSRKLINVRPPRLYDLQICALAGLYLHQSVLSQAAWGIIGHGLRIAQEMGAHRQKRYAKNLTVEGELMKRAFWVLMALDGALCSSFGRTCVLQDEDYDVDYPMECDDEYWENAEGKAVFEQPAGKPSKTSFFRYFLRLKQIHMFALRTVYAINRTKVALGRAGPQWEQDIVSEIDSALNAWIDSVPEHLRWDPHRENLIFFDQSVFLWTAYYNLQINIHRAFIQGKQSPMSYTSVAICTNAARSCIHILETQSNRTNSSVLSMPTANSLFTSAVVLLLNMWGSKRHANQEKDMEEVRKVLKMLKVMQKRWHAASRYTEVLNDLANVGDIPIPPTPVTTINKRPRSPDSSPSPLPVLDGAETIQESRPLASSRRFQAYQQAQSPATSSSSRSNSTHPPSLEQPPPPILDSFPPLSSHSGAWPSSCTISPLNNDPFPLSPFTAMSAPADVAYKPQPFPPLDQNSPPLPNFSPTGFSSNSILGDFSGPSGAYASSAHSSQPFGTTGAHTSGILDGDTLAMWSFAPSGFEWDEWGTYATNMTEMAGNGMNPSHM
ncbi:fungal-specific transcription factor domain-containing protein [Irpex rosettiformis]|uniref:Fungal-specific transcription factor domain-containing protein n=1 Tax=Irpex rosettiformis TaxID=378272 RepID=A0ACB8U9M2_9APHY|nr:fungal-specific transcription factor domain-containing protein [Irpex rosettiformis]